MAPCFLVAIGAPAACCLQAALPRSDLRRPGDVLLDL